MVLSLITTSPRAPNILRYRDRGEAELHLIELPIKSSANFRFTAFSEVRLYRILEDLLLKVQRSII